MKQAPPPERLPQPAVPPVGLFLVTGALSGLLSAALGVAGGMLEAGADRAVA